MTDTVPLSDLAIAAYCPRKLHYARQGDRSPPESAEQARRLSRSYPHLRVASDVALSSMGLDVPPGEFRASLDRSRESLEAWDALVAPWETDVFVRGKDTHGRLAKVLDEPLAPVLVSPGSPPETGVWHPQSVRAVGAAKALSWRESTPVESAFVEYPFHGVVRKITLTTRRTADYRRTLRAVRALDGPPPRLHDESRCGACEYADECGVQTRSLRSLLSLSGGR
ncbi:MAG: CRISPR-associated protein Cas4 [Halobacteriota archaeon]